MGQVTSDFEAQQTQQNNRIVVRKQRLETAQRRILELVRQNGDKRELRELLGMDGIDPNVRSEFRGFTSLHFTAILGHKSLAKLLLLHPATDPLIRTNEHDNETALHLACKHGHEKIVQLLANNSVFGIRCINAHGGVLNETALHICCREGRDDLLRILLSQLPGRTFGVPTLVEQCCHVIIDKNVPYYLYRECIPLELYEILDASRLRATRNQKARHTRRHSSSSMASKTTLLAVTNQSLGRNNDISDFKDLQSMAEPSGSTSSMININIGDKEGYTPLHRAVLSGSTPCIEQLLALPAVNINSRSVDNSSPLLDALASGNINIINLLLEHPRKPFLSFCTLRIPEIATYNGVTIETSFERKEEMLAETIKGVMPVGNKMVLWKRIFDAYYKARVTGSCCSMQEVLSDILLSYADREGLPLLHIAARHGVFELIDWFFSEVTEATRTRLLMLEDRSMGGTPIHWVVYAPANLVTSTLESLLGQSTLAEKRALLVENRAKDGSSPLHWATKPFASYQSLLVLLEHSLECLRLTKTNEDSSESNPNKVFADNTMSTPLHWIAELKENAEDRIKLLLGAGGFDPWQRNSLGLLPITIASTNASHKTLAVFAKLFAWNSSSGITTSSRHLHDPTIVSRSGTYL